MESSSYNAYGNGPRGTNFSMTKESLSVQGGENAGGAVLSGAYGGATYGRYMCWWWIVVIFVLTALFWVILTTFPSKCLTSIDNSGVRQVDLTKVLGASFVAALFITLIFWLIAAWL